MHPRIPLLHLRLTVSVWDLDLPGGLTLIGTSGELLGSGSFFGMTIIPESFHISIFVLAPGAFFVLAMLTALQNKFKAPSATNGSVSGSSWPAAETVHTAAVLPAWQTMIF